MAVLFLFFSFLTCKVCSNKEKHCFLMFVLLILHESKSGAQFLPIFALIMV